MLFAEWAIPENEWSAFIRETRLAHLRTLRRVASALLGILAAITLAIALVDGLPAQEAMRLSLLPGAGFALSVLLVHLSGSGRLRRLRSTPTGLVKVHSWGIEINGLSSTWHSDPVLRLESIEVSEAPPRLVARAYRRSSRAPGSVRIEAPVPADAIGSARELLPRIREACGLGR